MDHFINLFCLQNSGFLGIGRRGPTANLVFLGIDPALVTILEILSPQKVLCIYDGSVNFPVS